MTGILWAVIRSPLQLSPIHPNGQAHHVTLQYGVERSDWKYLIGLPVTVGAIAHCHNDRVQAITVALPTWLECQNIHPHITVSWVDDATPVEANAMLSGEHVREDVGYPIHCEIEFLEWESKPKSWRDRPWQECKQEGCTKKTRSISGYCRSHIPNSKYR